MLKSLLFVTKCGLLAKSFIPAHAGRKTTTRKQRSGIKRFNRFLYNHPLTMELMEKIYLRLMKSLVKGFDEITAAAILFQALGTLGK